MIMEKYLLIVGEINGLIKPEFTSLGSVTFNDLSISEWKRYKKLQEELKTAKREMRKEMGIWKYILWNITKHPFYW